MVIRHDAIIESFSPQQLAVTVISSCPVQTEWS